MQPDTAAQAEPVPAGRDRTPGDPRAQGSLHARWSPPGGETRELGLHVRFLGQGPPTILLLHGLAASNRYFGSAFDVLARTGRLVAPDLLGFGKSPRPDDLDYGAEAHTAALIETLERLPVTAPIHIVAHSTGVLAGLALAARRPEWIAGMLAFGPPLYRSPEEARAHLSKLGFWTRWFAMNTRWARWTCAWMCRHRSAAARFAVWSRPDLPLEVACDGVQHSWRSYSGTLQNLILAAQPIGGLDRLAFPLLCVAGVHDRVVDTEFLRELSTRHPQLHLEFWPGGHDLPLTAPERCILRIQELIQSESAAR